MNPSPDFEKLFDEIFASDEFLNESNVSPSEGNINSVNVISEATRDELAVKSVLNPSASADGEYKNALPMQGKIERALVNFGRIKRKVNVTHPQRLLVCVQQNHGTPDLLVKDLHSGYHEELRRWFAHQNQLMLIQASVDYSMGTKDCRFFIEALNDDDAIFKQPTELRQQTINLLECNECTYEKAASNAIIAAQVIGHFDRFQSPDVIHDFALSLMGMRRYLALHLAYYPADKARFIGIDNPQREIYEKQMEAARLRNDVCGVKEARIQDAIALNTYIEKQVDAHLKTGECGVLILGAAHFAMPEEYRKYFGSFADYDPSFSNYRVDKYLQESNALADTNIIVFEPSTLQDSLS